MDKSANTYTVTGLMLTAIGAALITQKLDYYIDLIVCCAGLTFSIIGYYKEKGKDKE
ncbi:hypothetical protein [Paraglaciecola sp.]|uniref:hypothetical protein n=1 Tax=Paraglaciecola sp. TaxID=1920173 RepID=UPI003EF9AD00